MNNHDESSDGPTDISVVEVLTRESRLEMRETHKIKCIIGLKSKDNCSLSTRWTILLYNCRNLPDPVSDDSLTSAGSAGHA